MSRRDNILNSAILKEIQPARFFFNLVGFRWRLIFGTDCKSAPALPIIFFSTDFKSASSLSMLLFGTNFKSSPAGAIHFLFLFEMITFLSESLMSRRDNILVAAKLW